MFAKNEKPLVRWVVGGTCAITGKPKQWNLVVGYGRKARCAAQVWIHAGDATWHTWDREGVGGENWVERGPDAEKRAKIESAASAIAQGFI